MSAEAEGVAWIFILAWLGLGALVVLVLAVVRYQREAEARREAARTWTHWFKEQRERDRVLRGRQ